LGYVTVLCQLAKNASKFGQSPRWLKSECVIEVTPSWIRHWHRICSLLEGTLSLPWVAAGTNDGEDLYVYSTDWAGTWTCACACWLRAIVLPALKRRITETQITIDSMSRFGGELGPAPGAS
jgi:hypothetical protein